MALNTVHVLAAIVVVFVPLLCPTSWSVWFLGMIPLVFVVFLLFEGCPLTHAETFLGEKCAASFGSDYTILQPVPLTPEEKEGRSKNFQKKFPHNFIRRIVFHLTAYRASASDVRTILFAVWFLTYAVFLIRGGHVHRLGVAIMKGLRHIHMAS